MVIMKKYLLIIIIVILSGCDSKTYEYIPVSNEIWMKSNVTEETFEDGTSINFYEYDSRKNNRKYGYLYSYNSVNSDKEIIKGFSIPTETQFLELINSFESVNEFVREMNIKPGGMYDYTKVEQWIGDIACFLVITDDTFKVFYIDISKGTYQIGNFHPDDAVSLRLVKND